MLECSRHSDLCHHTKYKNLMSEHCAKACKFCQPNGKGRNKK
ncbi:unnamed protein product [Angiostrongylus costaricensis]|uniref:ShKT domain-containing protein n=1 Tax=Angiostrongylus costaricensis TaxID=334426 RepID=A0A0R3PCP1_ANGCS|nr:unnamed protein product [Angiostrongylus costaricensis]